MSGNKFWWAAVGVLMALAPTIHNQSMRALLEQSNSALLP